MKFITDSYTPNGMNISTIGKDSVPVSVMDVASENFLTHRKVASFASLV